MRGRRQPIEQAGPRTVARAKNAFEGKKGQRVVIACLALALGFPKDVSNPELVQYVMKKNKETIAPRVVRTGPVKDVILRGDAIDQAGAQRQGVLRARAARHGSEVGTAVSNRR